MTSKGDSENAISIEVKKTGHTYVQWLAAILVATTLFNYGLQSGWISPMKKVLQSDESPSGTVMTDNEMSWLASTMPGAAVLGTFLYSYIADKFGRKIGILAMIVPQALCWVIKLLTTNTIALIVARICAGLPAGGCFNLVPMYVKEISQDNIRGALVALTMTFQNIGYLAMYAMGGYMNYYIIIWIAVCIPVIAGILFIIIAPESPAYLFEKGRVEDAVKTVDRLRGLDINDKTVQNEMDYMKNEQETFKSIENFSFLSIFKNKACRRGFFLSLFNVTVLDLNGTFSINTYAWTIVTQSGVTVNPELQTLIIPFIMICGSIVSITCVEKFGRKPIMVGALALSAVAFSSVACSLLLQQHSTVTVPSWVPVLSLAVCVWSYAAGVLPMVYVVLSEMFIFQVRAKLMGIIVAYAWFISFIQLFCYLPISNTFGTHTTFFIFGIVNLVGSIFSAVFLPETMGKSVEQIEKLLLGQKAN